MRVISSAQLTYALTCGAGFYAPNLRTLGKPSVGSREPFIAAGLGDADSVIRSNYIIQLSGAAYPSAPPTCNGLGGGEAAQAFLAAADPTEPSNLRFFGTNADNVIYEHTATLFGVIPEVGAPPVGHPIIR
jgi:hypothetical protein